MAQNFHPAFSVGNIKHHIPIVLDVETGHYDSWAELFVNTAQAFEVGDHISAATKGDDEATVTPPMWTRLDAIVKQWIFTTISQDLLLTILQPGATAKVLWDRIRDIFLDNKHTRAVSLERQFATTKIDSYTSASAYCQTLKTLADQLANAGSPVSNDRLVLQLVAGLNDGYKGVATIIQHSDPIPHFCKARSMIILEEPSTITTSDSALVTIAPGDDAPAKDSPQPSNQNSPNKNNGRWNGKKGKNSNNRNNDKNHDEKQSKTPNQFWSSRVAWTPYGPWVPSPWTTPPCPTRQVARSQTSTPSFAPGILGPCPAQAFMAYPYPASSPSYTPTDLGHSFQGMTLMPPDDRWFMDAGASSHMAANSGPQDGNLNSEM